MRVALTTVFILRNIGSAGLLVFVFSSETAKEPIQTTGRLFRCGAVGSYSNLTEQMRRVRRCAVLARKALPARPAPVAVLVRRVSVRIDDVAIGQLVADYEAGSTGRQLAERYGLARSTVIALLPRHGVAVRHPRVTAEESAEMLRLYRSGVWQVDVVDIAEQFGWQPGSVWQLH